MNIVRETMNRNLILMMSVLLIVAYGLTGCQTPGRQGPEPGAEELLGDPAYRAISYSGWRSDRRADELCPDVGQLKEDLRIMHAMGLRFIRTYNTQLYPQTERTLEAIAELKETDPDFEMYVMLGAWIQCEGAYTSTPQHEKEDLATNRKEINRAIELAAQYPDTVKVIAVGNEAMVHWQPHHVGPEVILKWVNVLRQARSEGRLPESLWITTSDNWAALGGEVEYHNEQLLELLSSVDFVSLHTYAFHDTYYYPTFDWAVAADGSLPVLEQRKRAVRRAVEHQQEQLAAVRKYMSDNGIHKAIHIGETGWASRDDSHYGETGTRAADEYTSMLFHDAVREWTEEAGMSCFYFQAFDEPWKSSTVDGSESHFGLITVDGRAKAVLWEAVDAGTFEGLTRDGNPITKTHGGDREALINETQPPVEFKFAP